MGFWTFILAISVVSILAGLINNWIKARHGYPITDDVTGASNPQVEKVRAENEQLKQDLAELTERLHVLERIATDPAERTSREIDELR